MHISSRLILAAAVLGILMADYVFRNGAVYTTESNNPITL